MTFVNTRGLALGKLIQNVFTSAKTLSLFALIVLGVFIGRNADAIATNFSNMWTPHDVMPIKSELAAVPDGANLGLGCGNPHAIAALRPGEVVVDLGSGAGFDCFLAAKQVGATGRVIGVDMTHEMLKKARENAARINAANIEFRLGELEHLPIADNTADVVLSNCVINLVPDKAQVFREALRVLKPGGRLAISDVVSTAPLSPELQADTALLCGCIAGAAPIERVETWLLQAGFIDVQVTLQPETRELVATWAPGRGIENFVASATVEARKPKEDRIGRG